MTLHYSGLLGIAKHLSEVTRFAFGRIEHKLPPSIKSKLGSNIDDLCDNLEKAQSQPVMIRDRVEAINDQLYYTWSQIGQYFSDEDNLAVAEQLTKFAGVAGTLEYHALFNELIGQHGLASAVVPWETPVIAVDGSLVVSPEIVVEGVDVTGESIGDVVTIGGAGAAGIGLVTVGNIVGGAAASAGSATGVTVATVIVKTGAAAVTTASSSAAALPIVGTTIATGITSAATTAATGGALVGSAAVAAAPVVIPVLAAWWLIRRALRD